MTDGFKRHLSHPTGTYLEDLLSDSRLRQPAGRGRLGIITDTAWDADHNTMAGTVDLINERFDGVRKVALN